MKNYHGFPRLKGTAGYVKLLLTKTPGHCSARHVGQGTGSLCCLNKKYTNKTSDLAKESKKIIKSIAQFLNCSNGEIYTYGHSLPVNNRTRRKQITVSFLSVAQINFYLHNLHRHN